MKNIKRNGFTIIEVVLVLAIAGLIFMMVFIALPALQRSQRDTQRSNDISRLSSALNNYQANNKGALPTIASGTTVYVSGHTTASSSSNDWAGFYDRYLLVGTSGQSDSFTDPDGNAYSLWVEVCTATSNTDNSCKKGQRNNVTFDNQSNAKLTSPASESGITALNSDGVKGHSIMILTNATCNGEQAIYSTGARKVAFLYKKEGGGTICLNN